MKASEILPAVMSGKKLAVGTFQDWEVRELPKKENANEFTVISTSFVLMGREVVSVQQFGDRGTRAAQAVRPALKPGDRVVVEFRDWQNTKWGTRVSGSLSALQS